MWTVLVQYPNGLVECDGLFALKRDARERKVWINHPCKVVRINVRNVMTA